MRPLPIAPAWRLAERDPELRWLVTHLWSQDAVGIVGGEPKCCKSFLALDLAVAVAAGVPCLRRFAVPTPGRVLLYAAEDAHPIVRRRLEGIAVAAGVDLRNLDIQVITAPTLRLDLPADRVALQEAVARLQPKLLILDPFVRLHRMTRTPAARLPHYWPISGSCSAAMPLPSSSSIMPRRAPATSVPARRCADPRSSTLGATATSICGETVMP